MGDHVTTPRPEDHPRRPEVAKRPVHALAAGPGQRGEQFLGQGQIQDGSPRRTVSPSLGEDLQHGERPRAHPQSQGRRQADLEIADLSGERPGKPPAHGGIACHVAMELVGREFDHRAWRERPSLREDLGLAPGVQGRLSVHVSRSEQGDDRRPSSDAGETERRYATDEDEDEPRMAALGHQDAAGSDPSSSDSRERRQTVKRTAIVRPGVIEGERDCKGSPVQTGPPLSRARVYLPAPTPPTRLPVRQAATLRIAARQIPCSGRPNEAWR
jgi:hypothetical protein